MRKIMIVLVSALAVLGMSFAAAPASGAPSSTGDVEIQVDNVFRAWALQDYEGTGVAKPSSTCTALATPVSAKSVALIDQTFTVRFYSSSNCVNTPVATLSAATMADPLITPNAATHYETTPAP